MFTLEQMEEFTTTGFINMETCTKAKKQEMDNLDVLCNTIEKYILVEWPEIQEYMLHPRWGECVFCCEIEGHPCPDSTYAVPESLYEEING